VQAKSRIAEPAQEQKSFGSFLQKRTFFSEEKNQKTFTFLAVQGYGTWPVSGLQPAEA
jgi:hypothetical protein